MKLVVTGASGFLGREVCLAALRRGHEVLALGGSRAPTIPGVAQARAFDLCSEAALEALLLEEFPQAVVHCAALPTIETCLADPARAAQLAAAGHKRVLDQYTTRRVCKQLAKDYRELLASTAVHKYSDES